MNISKYKIKTTTPGKADYPSGFMRLKDPPARLTYIGSPVWKTEACISIVGSREVHPLSIRWMNQYLAPLAKKGLVFVSGGARGIDQAAHAVSLRCEKPTIAFLPCGLNQC